MLQALKELPTLISDEMNQMSISHIDGTTGGMYLLLLLERHPIGCGIKEFCSQCGISYSAWRRMIGNDRQRKEATEQSLLKVSYGLGLSSHEALVLFYLMKIAVLIVDEPLNELLFKLDEIKEKNIVIRRYILAKNAKELGYDLKSK